MSQQQQNHAHVASSPATVVPPLMSMSSLGRHNNNEMHMYDNSYGYGSSCGGVGIASNSSSCAIGANMGVTGGGSSAIGGGGCMYDLEMSCGPNSVAYAHNQLLQYHHQQQQQHQAMQISRTHPTINRNEYNIMPPRKDIPLQQQSHLYQQQHQNQQLQNSLCRQPPINAGELSIKSEPPDEHNYKTTSFINDNEPFVDFVDDVLNPSAIELNIKEENSDMQQKAMNFPRRKLQTERSETLPICQRCKQVFFKKHVYASHVAESTCDIVEYDFKCSICPMSFTSMEELSKHKHLHRENKFFCHKFCGKFYNTIEDCEKHEYMQHEYKTFVCNICSGTFPAREMLYAHLPVHKFQQRFDCSVCRLWFQTPHELHEHRIGAPYFCGKYYIASVPAQVQAPTASSLSRTNYQHHHHHNHHPMMLKSEMPTTHDGYKLQDCHMGTIEVPPNQFQSPGAPATNTTANSTSFMNQRHAYSQQQQQQQHHHHQQQAFYNSNNFFPAPPVKTEIKVEPDFYTKSTDCQQQQQQQQHQLMSQTYSDYTNDSFSSSHNSSSFVNDYNESGNSSLNAQQTQSVNASSLDDSEDAVCCVPRCGVRKSTSPTLQFFTFPKDDKYLHQWLSNLKMLHVPAATYLNYRICSLHFPKRCINRYSLCYWAVPTFNLGHDDVANLYQNRELTNTFTSGEVARCSMPNCKSQRGESNVKFYNFPKDIKSLIKWCQNARLPVQAKEPRHFCGRHFEDRCIGKFRLKPWAVPTLNLGTPYGKIHDNPQNLYVEEKRCCLPFCRRSRSSDFNMSLYRFPRDEVLLQRWCYNLRLDPSVYRGKNHKICSAHFIKEALGLRKLSPGAVPTLNLGHNDTFNIYENELYSQATPPPPPHPTQQQKHYRHGNHMSALSTMATSANSINSSMYFPMDDTSPFSSVTCASSAPNVTESMDVCCVPGCDSKRNDSDVTFHTIPRRPEQMQKWCHNLKMEEEKMHKGLRICSLHFEPFCIGGCMRPFAVPTLKLGHDDENIYRNPDVIKKLNIRETCCVQICKRNRERDHANLHRFPSNPIMLQKWCENLHKPVPDGSRLFNDAICEVHFEDRCLRNKRLEKWSIPTLNLGHNDLVHMLPTEAEVAELYAKPSAPNYGDEEGECCVESCRRNPQVDDIRLYRTPEDPDVLAKWAHNLQIDCEDLTILRICNLHFESHCIGKRMHSWAIPTLNLGTNIENLFENPERPIPIKKEKPFKLHRESSLKPTWVPRCCLPHCRKIRAVDNVQLYRFPSTNRAMLGKWCHNLQVSLIGSAQRRVCSAHFIPEVLSKKCPVPHSVPTLDLNAPPGYKIYQNPARLKSSKLCLQRICIVESCRKKRSEGVHLFRFPHNITLLRKWLHNIKQRPRSSMRSQYRICSEHFAPHSFNGKRLSSGAIPTLNLGHDDVDIYPNEAQSFIDEQCTVPGCDSVKDMPDVRLFRFPIDDEDILWKWCNNLKMNPIDCHGVRICNKHFVPDCIGPKHLYKWAIPTIALGHDDTEIELMLNPKAEDRRGDLLHKCCVPSCGKTRKFDEVQMNSFPKDPKQFRRWKYNLRLDFLDFKEREKYKICNDHFEDVCLGKTRLNIGALPTLNLGHAFTEDIHPVNPEKIQSNLFGKHRPVLESVTTSDNSDGDGDGEAEAEDEEDEEEELNDKHVESNDEVIISDSVNPYTYDDDSNDGSNNQEESDLNLSQVKIKKSLDTAKCCLQSCRKSRLQHGVRLYNFPSGSIQFKKWHHNVQHTSSTITKHSMICELHFHKRCIDGRDLRPWAVPTINLGHSMPIYDNPKNIPGFFLPICALNHCRKRRTIENDLRTYQFPKGILLQKWCANLKLQPENCRGRICAEHFEPEVRGKLKLKTGAVPTLNLGHDEFPLAYDNSSIKENTEKHREFSEMQLDNTSFYEEDRDIIPNSDEDENDNETPEDDEFYDPLKFVETVDENRDQEELVPELSLSASTIRKEKPANNVAPICCLPHCRKEKTAQHHLSTFGFPKNRELLLKWCDNLKLNPVDCIGRVCVEHFDPEVLGSRKLKQGAVPTINVGHNEPLRFTSYGIEMPLSSDNDEGTTSFNQNVDKLNHSVFRLRSLKHSRKRKTCDSESNDSWNSESINPEQFYRSVKPSRFCCVRGCQQNYNEDERVRLYRFPKARIDYLKWQHNLQLKIPSTKMITKYKVCGDHFEDYCFNRTLLLEGSIPTLNLGHSNCAIYKNPKKIKIKDIQMKCFVPKCSSICVQGNKLYPMPTNKDLRLLWCNHFNVKDYKIKKKSYICGFHFVRLYENGILHSNQLSVDDRIQIQSKYDRIKKSAILKKNICSVPGCNTMYIDDIRLTKLPSNDEVCNKWIFNTKINYNEKRRYIYRVCLLHFERQFIAMARPKLWAVPTLNLNHNDNVYLNISDGQSITTSLTPQPASSVKVETARPSNGVKSKTPSPKRVPRVCCIEKCINETVPVRLFKFPSSDFLLQKWCVNTQKSISKADSMYVCEKHFEPDAICKQELRPWALPTLQLNHSDMIIKNAKHLGNFHSEEQESDDMRYIRKNYCAILSCFQKASEAIRLYQYPTDMALIRKWASNCKHRSFAASKYRFQICQDHFAEDCFDADSKQLRLGAVPTMNLGLPDGQNILQSDWVETKSKTPTPYLLNLKCAAPKCDSEGSDEDKRFFRFPKLYTTFVLWCKNLNVPVSRKWEGKVLCQEHFEQHCFTEQMRLHKGALPTLHLGHNESDVVTENPSTFERAEEIQRCCAPLCNKTKDDGVKLIMFPRNRTLFERWAHNLKIPASTHLWQSGKVCSAHFESNCFEHAKIKYGAMPTLHLGHSDTDIHYTNELTLGKKKKSVVPVRVFAAVSSMDHLKCSFPNCKEFENSKLKQIFNVPANNSIIRQKWCELMSCNPLDLKLQVCPLHYIINYEATIDELKTLELAKVGEKVENNSYISEIEESYNAARNNPIIYAITCAVPNCLTLLPRDYYKLYPLPYNQELFEKWIHNIQMNIDDIRRYSRKVCSLHFETRCINEITKRLKIWSVPTLNIPLEHCNTDRILYENPTAEDLEKPMNKCCIQTCENAGNDADITTSLHTFPLEADILKKWIYNTQQKSRHAFGTRICSLHFEKCCFCKKRLHTWAIPTLRLGHDLTDIYMIPSDKRLMQIKAMDSNESDESRMSYCNMDESSGFEPIVKMESLDDTDFIANEEEQTINSEITFDDNSKNLYNNENSTMNSSIQDCNNAEEEEEMALEVTLEVAHIESHSVYDSGYAQPMTNLSEQSYYSNTGEQNANARRCCITGCKVRNTDVGFKLHKFPQSQHVIKKWMHNSQTQVDPKWPWRYRICSRHFEKECFNGHRFRPGTMPTLHLGPKRPHEIYENDFESKKDLSYSESHEDIQHDEVNVSDTEDFEVNTDIANDEEFVTTNKSGKYCQVEGCFNHLHTDGITLHKFPQLPRLFKKWKHNTQIPIDKNYPWRFRVCCEHFQPECLSNSRLLYGSIPTLKLGPNAPSNIYENECKIITKGRQVETSSVEVSGGSICDYNDDYDDIDNDDNYDYDNDNDDEYDVSMAIEPEIQLQFNEDVSLDQSTDGYSLYQSEDNFTKAAMGNCCITGCKINKADPGITLHKYPSPPEHLKKWLHNTQVNVDFSCRWRYRVCSLHFEPACFRGTRIIYGCVPTLHLGPNTPSYIYRNDEVFRRLESEISTTQDVKINNSFGNTFGASIFNKLRCSIPNCGRVSGEDGVSLHRLPQDDQAKKKWLKICKLEGTNQYEQNNAYSIRICSRHFEKYCYMGPPGKRYLKPGVIPTLNVQSSQYYNKTTKVGRDSNFIYNEIKSGYGKCSLIHCQRQKSQHGVKIYKFPKSEQQQERWTHNLRIRYDPDRPWKYLICSDHFEECCISKRKLFRWAVPTLNLGYNVPKVLYTNDESKQQCTGNESSSDDNSDIEDNVESILSAALTQNRNKKQSTMTMMKHSNESSSSSSLTMVTNLYKGPLKQCFNYKTKICCLPHCRKPRGDGIKLFRLPTSVALIKKWEHNTGIAFNESQRNTKLICSTHFPSTLIGIRRLSKNAVPTLNLGLSAPINLHRNTVIEEEFNDDEDNDQDHVVEETYESSMHTEATVAMMEPRLKTKSGNLSDDYDQMTVNKPPNGYEGGKSQKLHDWPKMTPDMSLPTRNMTYKQHHCCVPHCGVARKGNLKLFRVPMDPILRGKWEKNLSMKFDINDRNINLVCSRHFQPELIGATRLARGSVPTLNLTPDTTAQSQLNDQFNRVHVIVCNVPGCKRSNVQPDVTLFNLFLRDANIMEKWCDNININIDNITIKEDGFNICNAHFETRCFVTNRKLNTWAIPTLNLGSEGEPKHLLPSFERSPQQCVVWNCQRYRSLKMRMFNFPTDKSLLKRWCSVLGVNEGINFETAKICSAHFPSHSYNGNNLVTGAVPSLLLPNFYQKHCIVPNCEGKEQLFRFPENRNICAKWCHNLKIEQLPKLHLQQHYCICNKHFELYCFDEGGSILCTEAVPTLELGHDDPNVFLNETTQDTTYNFQNSTSTLVKKESVDIGELSAVQMWQTHSWYASDSSSDDGEFLLGGNS